MEKKRALKDFGNVKKGDIGGFVESEDNLSQDDDCWIYDNAVVCGNARIKNENVGGKKNKKGVVKI